MLVEVAKINEIAPGGMKAYEVNGKEIILCNYDGKIFALDRRCGHMNAPLEMGTLEGYILTCPMHSVQFDITTGEALSGTIPHYFGETPPPKTDKIDNYMQSLGMLISKIKIHNLKIYPVKIEGDTIKVDI